MSRLDRFPGSLPSGVQSVGGALTDAPVFHEVTPVSRDEHDTAAGTATSQDPSKYARIAGALHRRRAAATSGCYCPSAPPTPFPSRSMISCTASSNSSACAGVSLLPRCAVT